MAVQKHFYWIYRWENNISLSLAWFTFPGAVGIVVSDYAMMRSGRSAHCTGFRKGKVLAGRACTGKECCAHTCALNKPFRKLGLGCYRCPSPSSPALHGDCLETLFFMCSCHMGLFIFQEMILLIHISKVIRVRWVVISYPVHFHLRFIKNNNYIEICILLVFVSHTIIICTTANSHPFYIFVTLGYFW